VRNSLLKIILSIDFYISNKPHRKISYCALNASKQTATDAAFIAKALGDIARTHGMSQIAKDTGLSRESLYRSLDGEHIPSFDKILKVTKALGIHLHADPACHKFTVITRRIYSIMCHDSVTYIIIISFLSAFDHYE
jgi:probable addiction module antidote protein